MKSIMEEASSISKAIDRAWNRAGKPTKFTVRILEEPEHNLFGLTTKSAKIAFFFDERSIAETSTPAPAEWRQRHEQPPRRPERPREQQQQQPVRDQRQQQQQHPRRYRPEWNDEMIQYAQEWIKQVLSKIGLPNVEYSTRQDGNLLRVTFNTSLTGTEGKDRMLYSSFACLIMTTLRQRFKKQLRMLKVVLTTQ